MAGRAWTVSLETKFWEKVNKTSTHWLWLGSVNEKGYGQFRVGGKVKKAHRVAFEMEHNVTLPPTIELHHKLDGCPKHCVRPGHLEPKTDKDHRKLHALMRTRSHREDGRRHRRS